MLCSLPLALVLGRHIDDAVGIDIEGDLDLRDAPRRRPRNPDQRSNWASSLLSAAISPLALEDADGDRRLPVILGR